MADRQVAARAKARNTVGIWIEAVLEAWESGGHGAVSARNLAQATGLPNSSIFHHFGSLERLFVSAQESAQASAAAWCARRLEELTDVPRGIESLPTLMAVLIDDWCERERRTAFAWRECQLLAARDAGFAESAAAWRTLWEDFWHRVCDRLGVAAAAPLTTRIFDGEGFFHMLRWRRPVDRAALDELCRGWSAWLRGELASSAPWRDIARARTTETLARPGLQDETARRIAGAAATVLGRGGSAGVTHRAVAAEAGLTLGVVSYKFRMSADLLSAAFETIYWRGISSEIEPERTSSLERGRAALINAFVTWPACDEYRLARTELMIAAMRDPALAPFAAQLRYLRGRNSGEFLRALLGPDRPVSALDAAIFSSFVNGQRNAHAGLNEEERQKQSAAEIKALLSFLQGG